MFESNSATSIQGKTLMESVYLVYIEDSDGDEILEGIYRTLEVAEQAAKFILEIDESIQNYWILEDFVRERADD